MVRTISCLVAVMILAGGLQAQTVRIFVSPAGSDQWSGTREAANANRTDGPAATLGRARDLVRAQSKGAAVEVVIAGGIYVLDQPLQFGTDDSGTAASPIVYRSADGQQVHLLGGREVGHFEPVKDEPILNRLKPDARSHVLQTNLKQQKITDFGRLRSRGFGRPGAPAALELFFNDQPMTLARWPNKGFVKIAGMPEDQQGKDEHGGTLGKLEGGFFYEEDEPAHWPSGALSRPNGRLGLGVLRHAQTTRPLL